MEDFENFYSKQMFADILKVDIVNSEQSPIVRQKKRSVFDVYCTTSSGVKIIVEVQHRSIPDYLDRVLYYSSFPILTQHNAGDRNYYLAPVYVVSFINFALEHSKGWRGENISRYSIREDQSGN